MIVELTRLFPTRYFFKRLMTNGAVFFSKAKLRFPNNFLLPCKCHLSTQYLGRLLADLILEHFPARITLLTSQQCQPDTSRLSTLLTFSPSLTVVTSLRNTPKVSELSEEVVNAQNAYYQRKRLQYVHTKLLTCSCSVCLYARICLSISLP